MYATTYEYIIENYLSPFVVSKYNNNCFLIQDNDSKHSAYICQDSLEANEIEWVKKFSIFMKISPNSLFL